MKIISREEARRLGLKRYFTGVACANGHIFERQVSNATCMICARVRKPSEESKRKNSERGSRWYFARREQELERRRLNYQTNIDYRKRQMYEYRRSRKAEQAARRRRHYQNNKAQYIADVRARTFQKKLAMPAWADRDAIASFYLEAARVTRETGVSHHVDHVIPLRGKTVCGLHVETNLQILPASVNMAKRNCLLQCA